MSLAEGAITGLEFPTNGVTTTFQLTELSFRDPSDLVVTHTPTGGVEVPLDYSSHYSFTGNTTAGLAALLSIGAVLAAGTLRVQREQPFRQSLTSSNTMGLTGKQVEHALDDLARAGQDVRHDVDVSKATLLRTVRVPDPEVMPELPAAFLRGGYALGFAAGTGNPVLLPSTPVQVTGNTSPPMLVASGLIPTSTTPATRAANRAYLQALINADPTRNICIPVKGGWPATEVTYHFDGTLSWPDGYPPVMCAEAPQVSLHFWSVDTTRVTYWQDADGKEISAATAADDPLAVVVTQYSDADGNPITAGQAADVVNFPGATSAAYRDIKAFIFFSGRATYQRPHLNTIRFVPRFAADVERVSAIYMERTEAVSSADAPMLRDVFVGRTGTHTASVMTYTACWIGIEMRGWSLAEYHNPNFSGIEPWHAGQGLLLTSRYSRAGLYLGESHNGLPCINPIVQNASLYSCQHALLMQGPKSEGGKSNEGNYQECDFGITVDNMDGTSQPYYTVMGAHINANIANLDFKGLRFFIAVNNYFAIKRNTSAAETFAVRFRGNPLALSTPSYRSIGSIVANNSLNAVGVAGLSTAVDADYIHGLTVAGNDFTSANTPIRFGVNSFNCTEHDNKAGVHPQESDAGKLAYTGADFIEDLGPENNGVTRITADATVTANCHGNGIILDTAVLTADRLRTLTPVNVGGSRLTMITRRSTDEFRAAYYNPDNSPICSLNANQFAIIRYDGTNFVKMAVGKMDDDGESSIDVITSIVNVSVVFRNGGQVFHTGLLTSNINMNLQSTDAKRGDVIRVTRLGGGGFTLTVRDATVLTNAKALNTNEWCDFMFDGVTWLLTTP